MSLCIWDSSNWYYVVDTLRMLLKDTAGEISHVIGIYSDKKDFL